MKVNGQEISKEVLAKALFCDAPEAPKVHAQTERVALPI